MKRTYAMTLMIAAVFAAAAGASCSRTEFVENPLIPAVPIVGNVIAISNVEGVPSPVPFDRVQVSLVGFDWGVIGTVEATFANGKATLTLPTTIPSEDLCKVGRDSYNDYEGFWPAEEVSDRNARVASFKDNNIIAYSGDTPVGRLYLTDWDGEAPDTTDPAATPDRTNIYYHYTDRPVALSGYNIVRGDQRRSFRYDASFAAGWNAYANVTYYPDQLDQPPRPVLVTTEISAGLPLRWRFEKW